MTVFKKLTIVFLASIFYFLTSQSAWAASLYLMPQSQTVYPGDTFIVTAWVDTESETINAVGGRLLFPKDKLEVIDTSTGGSIIGLWPQNPFYSNETGEVAFAGGIPEGFKGLGKLASITFQVLPYLTVPESASVIFGEQNSEVLLHDGKGTPATLNLSSGNYEITEKPENLPLISSVSHSNPRKWYRNNNLQLHWDLIENAQYSYLLSQDPLVEPDDISDRPEGDLIWMGDMEYKGLPDGIYYFTLKQKLPGEDWSEQVGFRVMIDAVPPEPFESKVAAIEGKYYLVFATSDQTSGVSYYEVLETRDFKRQEDPKEWKITQSPYLLEDQSLLSIIKIKAVDGAGNEAVSEILPLVKIYPWREIILVLAVMFIIWRLAYKKARKILRPDSGLKEAINESKQ